MRFEISKIGSGQTYEIRNIVAIAQKLEKHGIKVHYENIGDPVAKGEPLPGWMRETIKSVLANDSAFAYCHTKGVTATREYLAKNNNKRGGCQITPEDIIFFNGLGDAIARCYSALQIDARVILPEPTYTTHFLSEIHHASFPPITYKMLHNSCWHPDIAEMEKKVKSHPNIVGILVINPDNPTGFVYQKSTLEQIVKIAKRHNLFLIFDETYINIVYNDKSTALLSDVVGDVPAISMKSISKDFPWPGARCGWLEIYNGDKDPAFQRYIDFIYHQKMSEVCSTTLPQVSIPLIMENPEYKNYMRERVEHYQKLSNIAFDTLKSNKYVIVNRTNGAFYFTVVFKDMLLNNRQSLKIENGEIEKLITSLCGDKLELDKRFVYNLLGATGICVVPLTSFSTSLQGFRMTLLEKDIPTFERIVRLIGEKITEYVESAG
ncbi:MAG: pyridoxal phosphate-dependent aminotransferase [Deltaproteobacteria bacterium]|nr:pyridoxal phosphate-dependent aminotransferase [Deltaproteobacteria bacterium]